MSVKMVADGSAVSIFTVPSSSSTDETPHTDPLNHISRLRFHSSLPAPAIIKVSGAFSKTGTINLSSVSANATTRNDYNLFAHGRPGTPLVFGKVTVGSDVAPMCGSVPIAMNSTTGLGRWLHLGADETNVVLKVGNMAGPSGLGTLSFDWEVWVTDFLLDEDPVAGDDDVMLRIEADLFTVANGQFDSRRRYLRIANAAPVLPLAKGKTVEVLTNDTSGDNDSGHKLRYSVDGYVQEFKNSGSAQTFNAAITQVKF